MSIHRCIFCGAETENENGDTGHLNGRCPKRTNCQYCDEGVKHAGHVCGNWDGKGEKPRLVQEFEEYWGR